MRKLLNLVLALISVLTITTACTQDAENGAAAVGFVKLSVQTITSTNTRALDKETYNPRQMAVVIKNDKGEVVEQTDDHTAWSAKEIVLPVGTYTVIASSNGFDGNESGFDIPYYSGTAAFTVEPNTLQNVAVTCTLATVKVSVHFSDRFREVFSEANVKVSSAVTDIAPLDFNMATVQDGVAGYFPVGNITAEVSVKSNRGEFSSQKQFTDVKARDHYILSYDVADSGQSEITVTASANGNTYTYNIDVADFGQAMITATDLASKQGEADVWTDKARLSATVKGIETFDVANAHFEYKAADAEEYISIEAQEQAAATRALAVAHTVYADIEGLTPGAEYVYRVIYDDGTDNFTSPDRTFSTESCEQLPFANMDSWYMSGKVAYPCTEEYYATDGSFWDSSNKGTTTIANSNTTGESTIVHTEGGMSAKLASVEVNAIILKKFAAASLYTGRYQKTSGTSGAVLDWGRPFTSRPKGMTAWIQYAPGIVTHVGTGTPEEAGFVKNTSTDLCSVYMALLHIDEPNANGTAITVDNTKMSTFPDWQTDERVVAYAELPREECGSTEGEWRKINLEFNYHRTDLKATHILIVFSSSKYGDYFTGSKTSVMYVDDIEMTY